MKRFLVFAGLNYYPDGGWDDFRGSFETLAEAESYANSITSKTHGWDWWQVVDLQSQAVISRNRSPLNWSGEVTVSSS